MKMLAHILHLAPNWTNILWRSAFFRENGTHFRNCAAKQFKMPQCEENPPTKSEWTWNVFFGNNSSGGNDYGGGTVVVWLRAHTTGLASTESIQTVDWDKEELVVWNGCQINVYI